jgi:hypothetical protein
MLVVVVISSQLVIIDGISCIGVLVQDSVNIHILPQITVGILLE